MARRSATVGCLRLNVNGVVLASDLGVRTITVFNILEVHHECGGREVVDSRMFEAGPVLKSLTVNVSARQLIT